MNNARPEPNAQPVDVGSTIEQYLDTLRGHLITPTADTAVVIDEVRDHLWETVLRGGDPHLAIARFGDPGTVGRDLSKERSLGALEQIATRFAHRSILVAVAVVVGLRCAFVFTRGGMGAHDAIAIAAIAIAIASAVALSGWSVASTRSLSVDTAHARSVIVACGASAGCGLLGVVATLVLTTDLLGDSLRHESIAVPILTATATIVLAAAVASGLPLLHRVWECLARGPSPLAR